MVAEESSEGERSERSTTIPLDGDVIQYTGATASLAPERLGPLLRRVQSALADRSEHYRRTYERVYADESRSVYLCPEGEVAELGAAVGLTDSEVDAVKRAHGQQLRRIGTKTDRRDEFETALEIREAVVIGHDADESADREPDEGATGGDAAPDSEP
ncbi:hypothetical protein [Halobellus clavatus]|jgi:class 3 adenylate cyclase|uniref:DUF8048 domain-containing protein n=1 Tax=Halobellus clavatus TaxID=660517 RepID=A0A1H3ENE6_9EURY|nr:hypothetical protein SAMN04487946_102402 [Halobellus clavatus]